MCSAPPSAIWPLPLDTPPRRSPDVKNIRKIVQDVYHFTLRQMGAGPPFPPNQPRLPHPCAFCAQGWDTIADRETLIRDIVLGTLATLQYPYLLIRLKL